MDDNEIKHVLEAALLAAGRPLTLDKLGDLFAAKGGAPDRAALKRALEMLAADYEGRGIELKEVASGYRIQIRRSMTDWLQPLWEERAPRYTRALLETLALVAYRQPITRAEIEEVRGVVVSTNIVRTLLERNWVRVVGHRDVPGKPAMFGTTKDFLDYFGLKRLEDLPTLAEIKDISPEMSPQTDLVDSLAEESEADAGAAAPTEATEAQPGDASAPLVAASVTLAVTVALDDDETVEADDADDDAELSGPDLVSGEDEAAAAPVEADEDESAAHSAEIIPLRAAGRGGKDVD
jgi:segregation and condensation protein B